MRVIAGELKGRVFDAPHSPAVHPMSEKMRGALFNILGDISGLEVLDAYAGSGAVSIEAVSRGALSVTAIEIDRKISELARSNVAKLELEAKIKVIKANCNGWSENNPEKQFDLIILDPPYDKINLSTINNLVKHLKSSSLMILSHSGRETTPTVNGVVVVDNRMYGDAALSIYRKQ